MPLRPTYTPHREFRKKYPIVKILAHNRLQECRRAFNQKESESSEIEIVQQESETIHHNPVK